MKIKSLNIVAKLDGIKERLRESKRVFNNNYTNTKVWNDSFYYNEYFDAIIRIDSSNKLVEFSIGLEKLIILGARVPDYLSVDSNYRVYYNEDYHIPVSKQQLYNNSPIPTLIDGYSIKEIRKGN